MFRNSTDIQKLLMWFAFIFTFKGLLERSGTGSCCECLIDWQRKKDKRIGKWEKDGISGIGDPTSLALALRRLRSSGQLRTGNYKHFSLLLKLTWLKVLVTFLDWHLGEDARFKEGNGFLSTYKSFGIVATRLNSRHGCTRGARLVHWRVPFPRHSGDEEGVRRFALKLMKSSISKERRTHVCSHLLARAAAVNSTVDDLYSE